MRIVTIAAVVLFCICSALSQPLVRFHTTDGIKSFNISDIDIVNFQDMPDNTIMKIHFKKNLFYYPAKSIDSLKYDTSADTIKIIMYIDGNPLKKKLSEIDSICFEPLETKIASNVNVVNADNFSEVTTVDSTVIVFAPDSKIATGLKKNHFLVGEPSGLAPYGFLRKVVSVKKETDKYTVTTKNAELTEVIEDGIISFERQIVPQDTVLSFFSKDIDDKPLFERVFQYEIPDDGCIDFGGGYEFKIGTSVTVSPTISWDFIIINNKIKSFYFCGKTETEAEFHSSIDVQGNYGKEFDFSDVVNKLAGREILPYSTKPFVVSVGGVPVPICVEIDGVFGFETEMSGNCSFNASYKTIDYGIITYNNSSWSFDCGHLSNSDTAYFEHSANGSLKVYTGPKVSAHIYKMKSAMSAGLALTPYMEFDVTHPRHPWWELYGGICGRYYAGSEILHWEKSDSFLDIWRKLLKQADNSYITDVIPKQANPGEYIVIKGHDFGKLSSGNKVRFFQDTTFVALANSPANYEIWTDTLIKCKVPEGFFKEGPLYIAVLIDNFDSDYYEFHLGYVTDIEGNSYRTIRIGNKTWMAENLNTSRFRNGDPIQNIKDTVEWNNISQEGLPAWCYWENDESVGNVYGKLFNGYAVNDARGLAPEGWHIPNKEDFYDLLEAIGKYKESSAALIAPGSQYWYGNYKGEDKCGKATNASGFSLLPGGWRWNDGKFAYGYWTKSGSIPSLHYEAVFWLVKGSFSDPKMSFDCNGEVIGGSVKQGNGYSVRCVKDN